MKTCIIGLLLLWSISLYSQVNLVPNPSFEDTIFCPSIGGQLNATNNWINPNNATPDYYNKCSILGGWCGVPSNLNGYQDPNIGDGYSGICLGGPNISNQQVREYLEVQLLDTLEYNKTYEVKLYISFGDQSIYAVNRLGVYFSDTMVYVNTMNTLPFVPQIQNNPLTFLADKTNWMEFKAYYNASGTEQFIIIGNFYDNLNTDTLNTGSGAQNYLYYYIDDVSVMDSTAAAMMGVSSKEKMNNVQVFPNPASDEVNFQFDESIEEEIQLIVFNQLGEKVLEMKHNTQVKNILTINLDLFSTGLYIYQVRKQDGTIIANERFVIQK